MKKVNFGKFIIFTTILITSLSILSGLIQLSNLPMTLHLSPGQKFTLSVYYPLSFATSPISLPKESLPQTAVVRTLLGNSMTLRSPKKREFQIQLRMFGAIPIKKFQVEIKQPPLVIPSGQAIGVLISNHGVVVVGYLPLTGVDQRQYYPAKEAGIQIGDILLEINKKPVTQIDDVEYYLKDFKPTDQFLQLTIKRQHRLYQLKIRPVLCPSQRVGESSSYRIGIFIEDPAAGVGTLSFYEPTSYNFAGLGHRISNFGGRRNIPFQEGEIVLATINGIKSGLPGQPGEKIGIFSNNAPSIGHIKKNSRFGIYGSLNANFQTSTTTKAIPIAYSAEIKTGEAEILTVLNENKIESFKVEIVKVFRQNIPRDKGMIIKVTDPKLLKITGGIIQGMSGSPIIQNNKFIGAVTHVFVNDPTRGYGVLAEWMINELNLLSQLPKAS